MNVILTIINVILLCAFSVIVTLFYRKSLVRHWEQTANMWQRIANDYYLRNKDLIRERDTQEIEFKQREKELRNVIKTYRDKYKQAAMRLKQRNNYGEF